MTEHARPRRLTAVWGLLVIATLGSWLLGTSHGASIDAAQAGTAVALAVGFVKVRYIGLEFMEIRAADPALRWVFEAWVLLVGAALTTLYLVG